MISEVGRGGTIGGGLGSKATFPILFALLIGGCPKRQTGPHIVYVQPPSAVSTAKQGLKTQEMLTIDAPPPAPAAARPTQQTAVSSAPQNAPATHNKTTVPRGDAKATPATPEPAPPADATPAADTAQAPLLEPASPDSSEEQIRVQESDVRHRIDSLSSANYSTAADRQILEDAKSFVAQSEQALKAHDLLRAQELAEKAGLLLGALEQRP
jgi:hypothetical protein